MTLKKYYPAIIIIYAVLAAVLTAAAIKPEIDLAVSGGLKDLFGSVSAYSIGNFFEIWAEPVTLLPGSFIMAMGASYFIRKGTLRSKIYGGVAFAGSFAFAYQTIYRTVKYFARLDDIRSAWLYIEKPLFTDSIWIKLITIAAGAVLACIFVLISNKIGCEKLEGAEKVFIFVFFSYLTALISITVLKHIWGRMRYREYINAAEPVFSAWFRPQGSPVNDSCESFPSGHTSNALQLLPMTFIFDALGRKKAGLISRICVGAWIVFVMFTRILAGAHYLSDVCGGAFISLTAAFVCAAVIFRKNRKTAEENCEKK